MVWQYMKYNRHEEPRITCLLQRHFPMSYIAGYDLTLDKIIYLWDIQRRKRVIETNKEKKKLLAKEAALESRKWSSVKIY